MKAIDKKLLPKFLKVNKIPTLKNLNKYLLMPWVEGELVMVSPDQSKHETSKSTDEQFHRNYLVVLRKDKTGKYTKRYTAGWEHFDLLNKKL